MRTPKRNVKKPDSTVKSSYLFGFVWFCGGGKSRGVVSFLEVTKKYMKLE